MLSEFGNKVISSVFQTQPITLVVLGGSTGGNFTQKPDERIAKNLFFVPVKKLD